MFLFACDPGNPGSNSDVEVCENGIDDDGNGLADCADPTCFSENCPEDCADELDNDLDLRIDCDDPDCASPECPEICDDGVDNDGNLVADCDDQACWSVCDADGDGHLSALYGGDDCDDGNALVYPGAPEICDGEDNDCNGYIDEEDNGLDRTTMLDWCIDYDGDGYGNPNSRVRSCDAPTDYIGDCGDCNDADGKVNPLEQEICNDIDDDCDGLTDDNDPSVDLSTAATWYIDSDGDSYGDILVAMDSCRQPAGYVSNGDDCDDTTPMIQGPGNWIEDTDLDGYGAGTPVGPYGCVPPAYNFYSETSEIDCDDTDVTIYPGAPEVCEDLIDQDCDGVDASCSPPVCLEGQDQSSGDWWTVCEADANTAWVSHRDASGGTFETIVICQSLGYNTVSLYGGTCGDVCGYCQAQNTSCNAPGSRNFDGSNGCSFPTMCSTVMWECSM